MDRGLSSNVVVGERAAILQLLAGVYETLVVWIKTLLILDLALHVVNGVR